jgi:hypothetical protein
LESNNPTAEALIADILSVKNPESRLKMLDCPHCTYRWRKQKRRAPVNCPRCRRRLKSERQNDVSKYTGRKPVPDLLHQDRFRPAVMKTLVDMKIYKYLGIPEDMKILTGGREQKRKANLLLADRYLKSKLCQQDIAEAYRIPTRSAFHQRLIKAFKTMAEHGRFQITDKGRERVAEQKLREKIEAGEEF